MGSLAMAGSSHFRKTPNQSEGWRDKIVANLSAHAGLRETEIPMFKFGLVTSCFIKKHGVPRSGICLALGQRYYRPNGSEYTFQDVPLDAIVDCVIKHLRRCGDDAIPPSQRKDIFDKVMADLPPSCKWKARWEDEPPPLDPNSTPTTPFSAPRTEKSNATLVDDLARAAGLTPNETRSVSGQITWFDGMAGGKVACSIETGSWEVRGGRLGRDHTLEDVPTCYVRDRIMDYINDKVPEEKRAAARRAVFSDLTEDEINEYSKLRVEWLERLRAEESSREASAEASKKASPIPAAEMSRHQVRQYELLRSIDSSVDLTPHPEVVLRRCESPPWPVQSSVVRPRCSDELGTERVRVDRDIHHDCDQVRAMIKRFVDEGEWTIDELRVALDSRPNCRVTREQMNNFLALRGPRNGIRCKAFPLAWEFFQRREKLGLPLAGASAKRDEALLKQFHVGRAAKRRSTGDGAEGSREDKRCRQG